MNVPFNTSEAKVVVLGADHFPKDRELEALAHVSAQTEQLRQAFQHQLANGVQPGASGWLLNTPDHTQIKEQLAALTESASSLLWLYYAGYAVYRRGQLHLATVNSSLVQIHLNGLPLAEVAAILAENERTPKIALLDCHYPALAEHEAKELALRLKDELERLAQADASCCFVLAAPQTANAPRLSLAETLARLLDEGLRKNHEQLQLADLLESLAEAAKAQGAAAPLVVASPALAALPIATNRKFATFARLKQEGETCFAQQRYAEALHSYEQARAHFDADDEVNSKIRFIELVNEADKYFGSENFALAKKSYELAAELYDLPALQEKTGQSIAHIAARYFDAARYEHAKNHYARLAAMYPHTPLYKERLDTCNRELAYYELLDEADECYLRFDFERALNRYDAALRIYDDRKTRRRREECAQVMQRQQSLRDKIEGEVAAKIRAELQQQAEQSLNEERAQMAEQVAEQVRAQVQQQSTEHARQALEESLWQYIGQQPQSALFHCYLHLFPQGKYAPQAQTALQVPDTKAHQASQQASKQTEPVTVSEAAAVVETFYAPEVPPPTAEPPQAHSGPLSEDELWQQALHQNTMEAYMHYVEHTQESAHVADAYYHIGLLRNNAEEESQENKETEAEKTEQHTPAPNAEQSLWQQAKQQNTVQAYEQYLRQSAEQEFATEAKQRMAALQELSKIDELKDWEAASNLDTLEAYKNYIGKYPFGNFYAKARFRIARLEAEVQ